MKITYSNFFELIIYFFTKFYKIIKPASAGKTPSYINQSKNKNKFQIYLIKKMININNKSFIPLMNILYKLVENKNKFKIYLIK